MKEKLRLPDYDMFLLLVRRNRAAKSNTGTQDGHAGPGSGPARAPRPVACRTPFSFDLWKELDSVYEILFVSPRFCQSQIHVMHPFVSKDQRRSAAELEKERQRKRTAYAKKKPTFSSTSKPLRT